MHLFNDNSQTTEPLTEATTPFTNAAVSRTPLYFGPSDRPLFGWYHAPAHPRIGAVVMVVCPPLGHEYMSAHRSIRHLADRLAAAGIPALRFDYHGTGNSSGDNDDGGRLAAWRQSVEEAVAAARKLSGCADIGLVGLRMGATLAALAASQIDAACLVLWVPCVRGRLYVRELKALHAAGGGRQSESLDSIELEAGGFTVSAETQRDLARIDLESVLPRTREVLIVDRDDLPTGSRLCDKWSAAGLRVDQRSLPGYVQMVVPPHDTVVPHTTIASIVDWISHTVETNPARTPATSSSVSTPRVPAEFSDNWAADIRESAIHFGPEDALFGIVSEPRRADASLPAILLPNAGSTHHVGPTGLYVTLARTLAQAGFRCLRFDFPGLGDSIIADATRENDPYIPAASTAIDAALHAMTERHAARSFVLMGLCSGAHASFHAALDLSDRPIVECVLINPLTFYYKPGMSLSGPTQQYHHWQRYMRSIRTLSGWMKLVRSGQTEILRIFVTIAQRFRVIIGITIKQKFKTTGPIAREDLATDIDRLAAAERKLTFVFSRFDPGYDILTMNAGKVVKRLRDSGFVKIWSIDRANHTFDQHAQRRELVASIRSHLVSRYTR